MIAMSVVESPSSGMGAYKRQSCAVYLVEIYMYMIVKLCFVLFDLILDFPSTIFQLNRGESSWVEPVLS